MRVISDKIKWIKSMMTVKQGARQEVVSVPLLLDQTKVSMGVWFKADSVPSLFCFLNLKTSSITVVTVGFKFKMLKFFQIMDKVIKVTD